MTIHVLFKFEVNKYGGREIDVTSNSGEWKDLSPFMLNASKYGSKVFENLWQFSKVYSDYLDSNGNPSEKWFRWRDAGFRNNRAVRYPLGKDRIPKYLFWNNEKLSYINARKRVYAPIYAELVEKTVSFKALKILYTKLVAENIPLVLRDYDGYDHMRLGMNLRQVINNPTRKCGHGFVLAMMLSGVLEQCIA